ncbi:hypothetical protein MesoLjLa_57220 [Mesorhizobium sp. L-2-11]|nr:hypothetical protein MesoLjLa_57220 [Mesorhizobium sp. L-2-11]
MSNSDHFSLLVSKAQIADVAGRLFGAKAARRLWYDLGLPAVDGKNPRTPSHQSLLPHVAAFIEARLVADSRINIAARQLYRAYCNWAVETGAPEMTLTRFGLLMQQTSIRRVPGRVVTYEARFK